MLKQINLVNSKTLTPLLQLSILPDLSVDFITYLFSCPLIKFHERSLSFLRCVSCVKFYTQTQRNLLHCVRCIALNFHATHKMKDASVPCIALNFTQRTRNARLSLR